MGSRTRWLLDDEFFPRRLRLLRSDPWGSLDELDIFSDREVKNEHVGGSRRQSRTSENSCETASTCGSANSFHFPDRVSFPSSTNVSEVSDDSVCTEKTARHSEVSETLPDGAEQHKVESSSSWKRCSPSGKSIGEGSSTGSTTTVTSNSVQKQEQDSMTYETMTSPTGTSSVRISGSKFHKAETTNGGQISESIVLNKSSHNEQTTSGRPFRVPPNRSVFYDELDSSMLTARRRRRSTNSATKLLDSVLRDSRLFSDDDFFQRPHASLSGFFGNGESETTGSRSEDLRGELNALRQENTKLQATVQEVTAVNKRWQRHNNERRNYVDKLLTDINEQEQQLEHLKHQPDQHCQRCSLLGVQMATQKDDFEAERREKRKILDEKRTLEAELSALRQEVIDLKSALMEERSRHSECPCAPSHKSSWGTFCTSVQVPFEVRGDGAESPFEHVNFENLATNQAQCQTEPHKLYLGFPESGLATVTSFAMDPTSHTSSLNNPSDIWFPSTELQKPGISSCKEVEPSIPYQSTSREIPVCTDAIVCLYCGRPFPHSPHVSTNKCINQNHPR